MKIYSECISTWVTYLNNRFSLYDLLLLLSVLQDAPSNFSGLVLNSTAVLLTWSYPSGPHGIIISFTIGYNTSGTSTQVIPIPGNQTTNYTVDGLNEDTVYTFTVYASTRIGAGPSAELTARTDEYCMLCCLW